MQSRGRWSLATVMLAISGWAYLSIPPGTAPEVISKPSAAANRGPIDAGDQVTLVHRTDTARASGKEREWEKQFYRAGSNYFEFITRAAQAAYQGDAAAQYYIGRTLARCEETNALYPDADSAEEAMSQLAYSPALLELERREYLNCGRFRNESPFKGLPDRPGGYLADYWQSRAVGSGYPAAVVAAASESPGKYTPQVIATALATGNTEAMLLYGWKQATAGDALESAPILAAAWVLAACRSGANCGPTNDVLPLSTCSAGIELGCSERYTVVDELTANLGSQDLERANLFAENIQASLQYRDPGQLLKYLPF